MIERQSGVAAVAGFFAALLAMAGLLGAGAPYLAVPVGLVTWFGVWAALRERNSA